ncbi:hypothetical protein JQK87_37545, partial [Streptomyces sp. G44]|nr:hypothetical protein [Streptomyces sp. G44]
GLGAVDGGARLAVAAGGALAVALALRTALRKGPLRAVTRLTPATHAWVCWLLAYALLGDALLMSAVAGGPDGPGDLGQPATAALLALALAVAPATWCARLFAVRAGGRLRTSRGLDEFAASVRPLLLGVITLFLAALGALLAATDALLGASGGPPALAGRLPAAPALPIGEGDAGRPRPRPRAPPPPPPPPRGPPPPPAPPRRPRAP